MPPADLVLVLFDVDGTLTGSFDLDSATYLDALRETFGFDGVSDDWSSYRHVTDAGILAEVCEMKWGRAPDAGEAVRFEDCYLSLLKARLEAVGGLKEIAGAGEILRLVGAKERYRIAYATGAWKRAALCKLESAGLPTFVPAEFSDDALSREEICTLAQRLAAQRYGETFARVVSVGDGVWDVRTASRLGYGFVGIARDAGAVKLRDAGAVEVLPDFRDPGAFFDAVEREARRS